ncbi:MAG: PPC domain-containing protein [Elainellaceae cyanobacterium]
MKSVRWFNVLACSATLAAVLGLIAKEAIAETETAQLGNVREDGWQRVQQAYQGNDRQQFFRELRAFLQETGYTNVQPPASSQVEQPRLVTSPGTNSGTSSGAIAQNSSGILLQRQGTLQRGDSVLPSDGSLYDEYTFEGRAGQQVTISLESPDFDTYLILLGPNDDVVAQNDDVSATNLNSSLTVTLPSNGTYRVIANSYSSGDRGGYELTVTGQSQSITNRAPQSLENTTLEDLPDGDYVFEGPRAPNPDATESGNIEVVFRKNGSILTGSAIAFLDENGCFRGEARQNSIINSTHAAYDMDNEEFMFSRNQQPWDFDEYRLRTFQLNTSYQWIIQRCVRAFESRN